MRIGRIIDVTGSKIIGELEAGVDELERVFAGRNYAVGQVGSMVRIDSGDRYIFGVLTRVRLVEDESKKTLLAGRSESQTRKPVEIELMGQGLRTGSGATDFVFERGISAYPLPGQSIYVATIEELQRVYDRPDKATIKVGSVSQAQEIPVHLMQDDLVGKHFAVLGTTGSGKSCAVTLLLQRMIEEYPHAHVVLLDPHNEYPSAFGEHAELVDPTTMDIPHWLLNFEETIELFVGQSHEAPIAETNILKVALLDARKAVTQLQVDKSKVTVDTPMPYKLGDLIKQIVLAKHRALGPEQEPYDRLLHKIDTLKNDKRFGFLLKDDSSVKDTLVDMLSQYLRVPAHRKPISIIDLSGVPSDVVDVVVSVLCRTIFDAALWNPNRRDIPVLVVCEEAHRYAPRGKDASFLPTKRALARIAKEGRKYGVGLALVTQRPSELDESIMSQCNTIIALRMSNEQDQTFVQKTLPDGANSLVDTLPTLRTREALIVGEGTAVPVRVLLDRIPEDKRPRSADVPFAEAWFTEIRNNDALRNTVDYWREQRRVEE
ncbi:MAG TPA: DUF87 domain-containing protein [Candidatus Hydrogenedentes bacterium]|nr:DUF87 domain-containing protein [Candidatus Hydrogenedentota bacterium]